MIPPDYDVAILGAGLAGLSLAVRLAAPGFAHLRVLVVEPRTEYRRDRTWSYWALQPHPFEGAVAHRWDRWMVAGHGREVVQEAPGLQYASIPSDAFYRLALQRVRAAPHIDLRLGTAAEASEDDGCVRIRLPDGTLRAALAFDTRPPPCLGRHGLTQAFLGQEIETEAPVFDPGTVTLMDFRCPQTDAAHFTYVLPTSPRHALVEDTWFAPAGLRLPDHRAAIRTYMADHYGVHRFTVGFEERGALPMDPVFQPGPGKRLLPLGTAGGATRPSTGYAFNAIQARCDAVAADLALGWAAGCLPQPARPRPGLIRYMDRVLLNLLEGRPALAPRVFAALFAGCPPRALVRFLNDSASPLDLAAVATAIPLLPTLGAAARMAAEGLQWPRPAAVS